jgi:hypothetical protein
VFTGAGDVQNEVHEHDANHDPIKEVMDDFARAQSVREGYTEYKVGWD